LDYSISEVISRNHTIIGWTTHGHSGEDVLLWAYSAEHPTGIRDNTDIAKYIARELEFNLNKTSSQLFIEAGEVFSQDNGDGELSENEYLMDIKDPSNPVLRIGDAELPVNKNLLIKNNTTHELEGIIVYAPVTNKVYIPSEVLSLLNGTNIKETERMVIAV
jgi:alkaline phosphatase